jgi:hypothetical protein
MATLAKEAHRKGWSVRETERRARSVKKGTRGRPGPVQSGSSGPDPVIRALEASLQERLATRVVIRGGQKRGKGVIEIPFLGSQDFERIFALITGQEASDVLG